MASNALPASPKDLLIASHDVLVLIFRLFIPAVEEDHAPENRLAGGGRRQLLRLALTCKAFVIPSLECLWSHLDSLEPLFKLHPGLKHVGGSYFFRGSRDTRNLSRYQEYAGKVRTVSFRDKAATSSSYRIAFAGGTWLGHQLQGTPLLPGLRSIHFAECSADSLHLGLLPLMLSLTVERVEFGHLFLSTPAFHSFAFPLVCDGLPSLTELVLYDPESSGQISQDVWDALEGIAARLRSLALRFPNSTVLQPGTLRQLTQRLRNLNSLTLDVHTSSHQSSEDIQGQVLPLLHNLHLVNRSGASLCPCYPSFLAQKATSVTFSLTENVTNDNAFSESLDTFSTSESLRRVEIEGSTQSVTVASVRPFLQRLQLEEFHLEKLWGFQQIGDGQSDQPIQSLIGAVSDTLTSSRLRHQGLPIWRKTDTYDHHYEHRTRRWIQANHTPSYPPLSSLLYVAQRLEGLHHLSLSIDSSAQGSDGETVSAMIQNWRKPISPSPLRYLEIAEMRDSEKNFTPDEYRKIARFLDLIFPNLISVTMIKHPSLSTCWDAHWELIEEHRQMMSSLRLYRGGNWR